MIDEQGPGRVVVGVSGSLAGLEALRFGVAEARRRRTSLLAVRAWHFDVPLRYPDARHRRRQIAEEALRYVCAAFDAAMGCLPDDVDVTVVASPGRPDLVLTRIARDREDLLVVGGRAGRLRPWLVRGCMRRTSCPVTVVPPPAWAKDADGATSARRLVREAENYTRPAR